ncbi:Neuronal membrane glycoprotein M6-b [Trichinella sp. T9]|nr:Neuronal membrane glycoprotein M6-b [Trichinella sp. T9]
MFFVHFASRETEKNSKNNSNMEMIAPVGRPSSIGRVPFASLIALSITWIGVAVFAAMNFQAVNASLQQLRSVFNAEIYWLNKVQLSFIVSAVIMFVFAGLLTVIGALATGSTRDRVYYGWKARLGGRISTALFLTLTYLVHIFWLAIFTVVVSLCFVNCILKRLCATVPAYTVDDCLDLNLFSVFFGDLKSTDNWKLCGAALQQFCVLTESANNYYIVSYFASLAVLLGLVHFMICLSANYAHIKDGFKYSELKEIQLIEETELKRYPQRRFN